MALVSTRSALNPNAPLFIPAAFRRVEDFSPEWWELVTTSTWYHDYWLSQHQGQDGFYDNSEDDFVGDDVADLLPDTIDFCAVEDFSNMESQWEEFVQFSGIEPLATNIHKKNDDEAMMTHVNFLKSLEESEVRSSYARAKYAEKPFKSMGPKYTTRRIQQPR